MGSPGRAFEAEGRHHEVPGGLPSRSEAAKAEQVRKRLAVSGQRGGEAALPCDVSEEGRPPCPVTVPQEVDPDSCAESGPVWTQDVATVSPLPTAAV